MIEKRNLHGRVVHELGARIVRGDIRTGHALPDEDTLAADMDVSRTVIREAVKALAAKGMVETRPRRGTVVLPLRDWNNLDPDLLSWQASETPNAVFLTRLVEVRRIVEPAAAALAAVRATDDDRRIITEAHAAMESGLSDVNAFHRADMLFHVAILAAAHNEFLLPVTHAISTAIMRSLQLTNRDRKGNAASLVLHTAIRDAILAGDEEGARRAMQVHLDDTWALLSKAL